MNLVKVISFLTLGLLVTSLYAQNNNSNTRLEKSAEVSIYFDTDQYNLDLKSQQTLKEFTLKYVTEESFEFRLRGFTDDVGRRLENEKLAKNRASAVEVYLTKIGVNVSQIKILACEELALDKEGDIRAQRKENRRVVVEYWIKENEAIVEIPKMEQLTTFFEENRSAAQQEFSFQAAENTIITGAKGTILQIPANCFVNSKGISPEGTVTLVLQEAYTYKDMILQNLATTSNDQLLETGGMLYLEAKDAAGDILKLREGANISAQMASTTSRLPRMQTFEGDNPVNSIGNAVNWTPTGQFVSNSMNQINEPVENITYRGALDFSTGEGGVLMEGPRGGVFYYKKSGLKALKESVSELNVSTLDLPRKALVKPKFKTRAPRYPNLKRLKVVSKENLKTKYSKSYKETKAAYNRRILSRYIKEKKVYRKGDLRNRQRIRTYKRDSINYAKVYKKHEGAITAYNDYEETMKAVLADLYRSTNRVSFQEQKALYTSINKLYTNVSKRNSSLERTRLSLITRLESLDTIGEHLLAELNNYTPESLTKKELELLKKAWKGKGVEKLIRRFYKASSNSNLVSYERRFASSARRIEQLYTRVQGKEYLSSYDLKQIRKQKSEISSTYNYKVLAVMNTQVQTVLDEVRPILDKFIRLEDSIVAYQSAYDSLRVAYNLPKDDYAPQVEMDYSGGNGGVLNIRNMGWINCDRFYDVPQEMLVNINIRTKETENTSFYVIFRDINSVMRANLMGAYSFAANRVPQDEEVTIIGLKKDGDDFQLFIEEGMVWELNTINAEFETKTKEELELALAQL